MGEVPSPLKLSYTSTISCAHPYKVNGRVGDKKDLAFVQ